MIRPPLQPRLHLFVCTNRRASGDPLGEGCGARGEAVFAALKRAVFQRGDVRGTWVTRTGCLGICPKVGATVARAGGGHEIASEVTEGDAEALLAEREAPADWAAIEEALARLEALEARRVLDLARRLNPRLTAEDLRNPHDFPELEDNDWHYADGVLTGVQGAANALRAIRRGAAPVEEDT